MRRRQEGLAAHTVDVPEPPLRLAVPALAAMPGVTVLRAEDVTFAGRIGGLRSLSLGSGDRLVVNGTNGSGKSTLLALLAGNLQPTTGTIHRVSTARIGLLTQESPVPSRKRATDVYRAAWVCWSHRGDSRMTTWFRSGGAGLQRSRPQTTVAATNTSVHGPNGMRISRQAPIIPQSGPRAVCFTSPVGTIPNGVSTTPTTS